MYQTHSASCNLSEKVQIHAARIVTGFSTFASKESLHLERGWDPLCKRRGNVMLMTMCKIHYYLADMIDHFGKN
jgi:hypothetical protein